jgi:hypothetical protein
MLRALIALLEVFALRAAHISESRDGARASVQMEARRMKARQVRAKQVEARQWDAWLPRWM